MTSDEQRAASGSGADPMTGNPVDSRTNGATNGVTDPDRLDLLDRYWDATTGNGFQRAGAIALDPAHARTVDLLQTLTNDATAGIPADARARIWRETVATAAIPTRQESPVTASAFPERGAATPNPTLPTSRPPRGRRATPPGGPIPPGDRWAVPGGSGPARPTGRTWWPRLQFAVAAALILGLFATILAPMDDGRVGLFGGIGNDATPTANPTANTVPSIGYPDVATSESGLVDLPLSASGHTVTIDRVLLEPDTTFDLPAGSVYFAQTGSGVGSSRNPDPSPQTSEPAGLDIRGPIENGGSLHADADQTALVTILRIATEGTPSLASGNGVTVFPMTSYTTGEYRFETQVSIVFGIGPVPRSPEQVGPLRADGVPFSDGQGISLNGATMLLYAEQGSIQMTSRWDSISDPASGNEYGSGVRELRLEAGTAAVTRDPFLTIQEVSPDEDASYTVAFISPPPIDQTAGRTYPNTRNSVFGFNGQTPIATDGSDYRIILDRLTLQPGAITAFSAGTYRAIQWTGGGDVAMVVGGGEQSPFLFPSTSLGGSFGDQSFSLVANGDAPVTMTLMSWLPTGASDETVPDGQAGLIAERLTAYTDTNPFATEQLQLSFYAAAANGVPTEIDPGIGLNIGGANTVDSYALIRPEDGPISLNRPARRIVDGV